jgi:capsular exopolysaccharide synthesis family protein
VEPLEYVRILRRRKLFVALAITIGVVAGWVSAPGDQAAAAPKYHATHTLILNPAIPTKTFNMDQAALIVTTGVIPQNVATTLGQGADPVKLAKQINAKADTTLGTMSITAEDSDPAYAVAVSDAFAQALVDDLSHDGLVRWQAQHDQLQATVNDLQTQLDGLEGTFDPKVASPERSKFDNLNGQFQTASSQLLALNAAGPPPATFTTLESARATPVSDSGLKPPDSKPARALLLGGIGLLLGIGIAFAAERLETRLTTKRSAEAALGLPVVAEIPNLPKGGKHNDELMTATNPAAPFVEAYRGLRTIVLLKALDLDHADEANGEPPRGGKVVIVSSPGAGEGKTTTTAHLAALLAEAGHSVLVMSADFRRPRVHELFGVEGAPGLSEVLAPHHAVPLRSLDLSTPVKGVKLLPSGAPVDNPARLLGATVELMRGSRPLFDFILVDTAPLLLANDASELIQAADMVLLVTRAHRTTIDACGRTAELLQRIDAPIIGALLVGASDVPSSYRYYRYRYYGASSPPSLTDRVRGGRKGRRREHGSTGSTRSTRSTAASEPTVDDSAPVEAANGATNGSTEHELSNESLSEFWREFKERR